MANFSTKIFGLAGTAMVFASMAFGQGANPATCATPTSNANFVSVENTTAQVAQYQFTCTIPASDTTTGLINVQIFLSPALPVTSKITTSSTNTTEAIATVAATNTLPSGTPTVATAASAIQGTISNNTLSFNGLNIGTTAGTVTVTISNVRVNPTSIAVGSGVPPAIQMTSFISGSGAIPVALGATTVAFAQSGLSSKSYKSTFVPASGAITSATTGANNFVICNKLTFPLAQVIQVNENYNTAFKAASESSVVGAYTVTGGATTSLGNAVATNDRIQLAFTNVPANVTLYLPVNAIPSQNGAGLAKIQLTASATGAFSSPTASTSTSAPVVYGGGVAAITATSGTATAYFDVNTEDPNNLDQFNIPIYVVTAANAVAGSATPISVAVSYAPVGAAQIPSFAIGSSTVAIPGSAFNLCTTSLLFPFVTNQLGFDTGLAISNTSTDPFGTNGATAQAGTCTLNFYGAGAPSPANVTTPNVPSGTVFTQVLSGVAAGFQGYIIAQCAFQYAHGFAFITDGIGVNGGLSQGYLAGVIPDVNQKARGADPAGVAVAGTGETLGN